MIGRRWHGKVRGGMKIQVARGHQLRMLKSETSLELLTMISLLQANPSREPPVLFTG